MFSSALLVLAAVSPAFATVFLTEPTQTSSWVAGQPQTISWKEDANNTAPLLAQFGAAKVSVYVGSPTQQTLVQDIANADVSTTSSIVFTPDPNAGENGDYYFIRFDAVNTKDPSNPANPAQAFSAKFTLSGMTGTFSDTVKAQISGAASGATTPAAASTTPAATTPNASSSHSTSSSKTSSSSSTTNTASGNAGNGASSLPFSALTCAVGVVAAVFSTMFL